MKDSFTFEDKSEEMQDFAFNEEANQNVTDKIADTVKAERHRQIKCGLINTAISIGLNSIPLISSAVKNKKAGIPNKINKYDIIRLAVTTVFPVLQTVDVAFLNNKLTEKFKLNDIRNVTNVVMAYPAAHKALGEFVTRVNTPKEERQNISAEKTDAFGKTLLAAANLFTPYVTEKLTDNNLTIMEKINRILPIPIIGSTIRWFAGKNPQINNLYQTGTGLIKFASGSAKSLGNAIRSEPGSTLNKTTSAISTIADNINQILGAPNGNVGYGGYGTYSGGYNGGYYGGPSRWGNPYTW